MDDVKLCDYGCGQPAIHQFKNGKKCCEKIVTKCNSIKILLKNNTTGKKHITKFFSQ